MVRRTSVARSVVALWVLVAALCTSAARSDSVAVNHLAQSQSSMKPPASGEKKIIRTGEVTLVVDSYESAVAATEEVARVANGYVASSQVDHGEGRDSSAQIVLRVPSSELGAVVQKIGRLGSVLREAITAEEIGDQYYDLKARLDNARKVEVRLRELASQTGRVADLLQVERELGRVREEIE